MIIKLIASVLIAGETNSEVLLYQELDLQFRYSQCIRR